MDKLKCAKCGKKITSELIIVSGKKYHVDCYAKIVTANKEKSKKVYL